MSKKDKMLSAIKQHLEGSKVVIPDSSGVAALTVAATHSHAEMSGTKRMRNAREIAIEAIRPDPDQPRKKFDPDSLEELASSIRVHGILQPITVEFIEDEGDGYYKIISGERRYQASQMAGLDVIPCIIHSGVSNTDRFARQLVENLQRADLSPIEKARSLMGYKKRLGSDAAWEEVEKNIGLSRRRRQQLTALLNLPKAMQDEIVLAGQGVSKNEITEKHARALLALNSQPEKQLELFDMIRSAENPLTSDMAMSKAKELKGAPPLQKFVISYENEEHLLAQLKAKVKELSVLLQASNKG